MPPRSPIAPEPERAGRKRPGRTSARPSRGRRKRAAAPEPALGPAPDCRLCPRLTDYRHANRAAHPDWHNGPVPSFAPVDEGGPVRLLIVGLAPGLRGANRTGRPFTGDYAGTLLYPALAAVGLARGRYAERADDGFELLGCRVTNAVRCVPPANKPTTEEVATCRRFLAAEIRSLPDLAVILALGTVAHGSVLAALGRIRAAHPFRHGALHGLGSGLTLADSYHCSRYNVNTGRLSRAMFERVIHKVRGLLDAPAGAGRPAESPAPR